MQYFTKPPIWSSPEVGEELYIYLAMLDYAASVVLFWHAPSDGQKLVYYMSKALVDAKTCYSQVVQTTLTLRIATKSSVHTSRHIKWQINHWRSPCTSHIYSDEWWSGLLNYASTTCDIVDPPFCHSNTCPNMYSFSTLQQFFSGPLLLM